MRIAICEDNAAECAEITEYIRGYCARNTYACDMETFETGEALLAAWEQEDYGTAFLDIYLPGLSGVEAARRIREFSPECPIVFITASEEHALECYGLSAQGYVVKPIQAEAVEKALAACRATFEKHSRGILVTVAGQPVNIALPKVSFIEAHHNEIFFHMESGVLKVRMPLDEAERRLNGAPFLRCHKSYLVNMNHVGGIGREELTMKDGQRVPIRKNGSREVRVMLSRYLSGHKFVGG